MWIFQNDSFLSVVAHRDQPGMLLIRSRIEGDIERAVPGAQVFEIESADYRYRAIVPKEVFANVLADSVREIDYPNFKNSVRDKTRAAAYLKVWEVMAEAFGAFGITRRSHPPVKRVSPTSLGYPDDPDIDAFLND